MEGGTNMPLEIGGRADKMGNRYEIRCIIYEMLKVLREINYSVVIEALGDDEVGTDILITDFEGRKEHQQCKARNASKEYWSIADLKSRNILNNWKKQLERGNDRKVALVFHPLINSTFWRAMYQQLFLLIHQCHQDCISNGTQSVLHLFLQNICRYDS